MLENLTTDEIQELQQRAMNSEERFASHHYDETTFCQKDARTVVQLPFLPNKGKLGHSLSHAVKRFLNLETRLEKNENEIRTRYNDFIQEFIDLNYLVYVGTLDEITDQEKQGKNRVHEFYYIPHHCVEKDSTTTKLRVVFEASAKTSTGLSLSDLLAVGPKIQDDLFYHLIRYRYWPVALSGDVAKMYRQFELLEHDQNFHRLIWRFKPDKPLKVYAMHRVTYGISSSSYHAIRSLRLVGEDCPYPDAKEAILNDFYVGDYIGGAEDEESAKQLMTNINQHLSTGRLELRKWCRTSDH